LLFSLCDAYTEALDRMTLCDRSNSEETSSELPTHTHSRVPVRRKTPNSDESDRKVRAMCCKFNLSVIYFEKKPHCTLNVELKPWEACEHSVHSLNLDHNNAPHAPTITVLYATARDTGGLRKHATKLQILLASGHRL